MTRSKAVDFTDDTIFALATASGRAGIAVVRVSGPRADEVLLSLSRRPLPPERKAVLRTIFSKKNDDIIDRCLVLRFDSNSSYTGENIVEFQVHGGYAVIISLLGALSDQGLRVA